MTATIRASWYGGSASEPAGVTAETGVVISTSDAEAPGVGTAPILHPSATGTNFSYPMLLALEVTVTSATAITDRTIAASGAFTTGLGFFFADQPTYRQPGSGNQPAASGSNGATPTPRGTSAPGSYTGITTSPQGWDATSHSAGAAGRNGDFVELVGSVSNNFAGGSGQDSQGNLLLRYTES